MINSVDVKNQLPFILRLLKHNGGYIEFVHLGEIVRMHIEPTGKVAPPQKRKKRAPADLGKIITEKCEECGGVMINSVCVGAKHPANKVSK